MADVLLQTKLYRPTRSLAQRPFLVSRAHLSHKLQSGLPGKMTLISAPAGFGKTTMVVTWLDELADTQTRIGWLSLDEGDNDIVRFLAYFVAALQLAEPQLGQTAVHLLQSPQPAPPESVLSLLINDLSQSQQRILLVLDDYHAITARPIHQAVTFLLDNLPSALHLIFISRSDPPLPLSRLRARGNMNEIRAADLRFSAAETAAFLNDSRQLNLTEADIAALEQRTEGWIAGLQLAALSLQGHDNISGFIASFSGNSRYIMDYLVDEVLQKRPSGSEQFLLKTAVLERLCGPLCDIVTERNDSQTILEQFERSNLFIVPLDDQRKWYRYHPLFADVLRNRLQQSYPELLPTLYQRASVWCEVHQLLLEAIDYALHAPDFDRAARLIEIHGPAVVFQGQQQTLLHWLNQLPRVQLAAYPSLFVYQASVLMFTNQIEAATTNLQLAEQAAQTYKEGGPDRLVLGHVAAIRADLYRISGHLEEAFLQAQQALDLLPQIETTPLKLRASALLDRARAFRFTGDVRTTQEQFASSIIAATRASGNSFAMLNSVLNLAYLQKLQGRLRQAEATYATADVEYPQQIKFLFGGAAYYVGLGELYREQNKLDRAADYLQQGVTLINSAIIVDADTVTLGFIALAWLQQNQGDPQAANATLNTLAEIGQQRHFAPHLLTRATAAQAQLWLAQNNLAAAANWADNSQFYLTDDVAFPYEPHYLALVRVRLAQNRLAGIRPLLHHLQTAAAIQNRQQSLIEIHILHALTDQAANDLPAAMNSLQQALTLAAPEGYLRLFADEGEPITRLLSQLPLTPYLRTLLQALHQSPTPLPLPSGIDSLSEREMEVLHLIADGASNQEIATTLVVTVSTVKKHVSNILSKLNTTSRTQAVAEARTLNLL